METGAASETLELILDVLATEKLPIDHVSFNLILDILQNLSKGSVKGWRHSEAVKELCAAVKLASSGTQALQNLRGIIPSDTHGLFDVQSIDVPLPSERTVDRFIMDNTIDPGWTLGISATTIAYALRNFLQLEVGDVALAAHEAVRGIEADAVAQNLFADDETLAHHAQGAGRTPPSLAGLVNAQPPHAASALPGGAFPANLEPSAYVGQWVYRYFKGEGGWWPAKVQDFFTNGEHAGKHLLIYMEGLEEDHYVEHVALHLLPPTQLKSFPTDLAKFAEDLRERYDGDSVLKLLDVAARRRSSLQRQDEAERAKEDDPLAMGALNAEVLAEGRSSIWNGYESLLGSLESTVADVDSGFVDTGIAPEQHEDVFSKLGAKKAELKELDDRQKQAYSSLSRNGILRIGWDETDIKPALSRTPDGVFLGDQAVVPWLPDGLKLVNDDYNYKELQDLLLELEGPPKQYLIGAIDEESVAAGLSQVIAYLNSSTGHVDAFLALCTKRLQAATDRFAARTQKKAMDRGHPSLLMARATGANEPLPILDEEKLHHKQCAQLNELEAASKRAQELPGKVAVAVAAGNGAIKALKELAELDSVETETPPSSQLEEGEESPVLLRKSELVSKVREGAHLLVDALDGVVNCQRKAACKLLTFRLQDLQHHFTIPVARFAVAEAPSKQDLRIIVGYIQGLVFRLSQGMAAVAVRSFDGEFALLRQGTTRPTTIHQLVNVAKQASQEFVMKVKEVYGLVRGGGKVDRSERVRAAKVDVMLNALQLMRPSLTPVPRGVQLKILNFDALTRNDNRFSGFLLAESQDSAAGTGQIIGASAGQCPSGDALWSQFLQEIRPASQHLDFKKESLKEMFPDDFSMLWELAVKHYPNMGYDGIINVGTLLTAWRAQLATKDPDITLSPFGKLHTQAMAEFKAAELRDSEGVVFDVYSYIPEIDSLSGVPMVAHEDWPHKIKLLINSIRRQAVNEPEDGLLISKYRIIEVCKEDEDIKCLASVLAASADPQNVPICEALLYSTRLREKLLQKGYVRDAIALEVFAWGHAAFDAKGMTTDQRTEKLELVRLLITTLFAERLRLAASMSETSIRGLPRDLLLAMLADIEGRSHLLKAYPWLHSSAGSGAALNERALSTNDLETEFSTIVRRTGFKPSLAMLLGVLRNVDFLTTLRRNPESKVSLPASASSSYTHQQQTQDRDDSWHQSVLLSESSGAFQRLQAAVNKRAMYILNKMTTIRDFHRHKGPGGTELAVEGIAPVQGHGIE